MSNVVEKVKAKVESVLHKDKDHTAGTTTGTHTGTHAGTHAGTHTGAHTGTHAGAHTGTHAGTHAGTHTGTHTGTHPGTHTHITGNDPTGPHSSHLANEADPRVNTNHPGSYGNTHGTAGYAGTDPNGPHQTRIANEIDPNVNTRDQLHARDNVSSVGGTGYGGSDPTGPHDSRIANKLDPRVDSDTIGAHGNTGSARHTGPTDHGFTSSTGHGGNTTGLAGTTGGYSSTNPSTTSGNQYASGGVGSQNVLGGGPGPASNTAGPHGSDVLNKLDPRVDSDLDGSKTYGGNKTSGF